MTGIKNKKLCNLNHAAFSLIELIVSMSIITLLTALFLANYHSVNRRTDLTMAAQVLVTDIRMAQANALGLMKYDGLVPAGGWGVAFDADQTGNTQYSIFADENDNQNIDSGEAAANLGGRVVDLPPNIEIDRIYVNTNGEQSACVTFLPPDPITRISGSSATGTIMEIRLHEKLNDTTKTVRVNFLGLIEVID